MSWSCLALNSEDWLTSPMNFRVEAEGAVALTAKASNKNETKTLNYKIHLHQTQNKSFTHITCPLSFYRSLTFNSVHYRT